MTPDQARALVRGKCYSPRGTRDIFATRRDAKDFARTITQRECHGRGKAYRCSFADHYHVTRSLMGQRSRTWGKR